MLTQKIRRSLATNYVISMFKLSISVEVPQKFVFKCLLKGTQGGLRTVNKLQSTALFSGFLYLTNLFKSAQESENMCP